MKLKISFSIILIISICWNYSYSQEKLNYSWWNPADCSFNVIEGQGWPEKVESRYDRLPKDAETALRKPLWNLSKNSASLVIRFKTISENIIIRYKTSRPYSMNHMPATGVSGVDLYMKSDSSDWLWVRGRYSFKDTISYSFKNISLINSEIGAREYYLYLPLYNSVKWLEIGVPDYVEFDFIPARNDNPIMVYGTSIAQGACASRPGMAWPSILGRKLNTPIINLGFSGNGRLEKEIIDLISEIEAKIYILDCLPNLVPNKILTLEDVYFRIISSVKKLKQTRPSIPILLVEHAGYSDGLTNRYRHTIYTELNRTLREAYVQLQTEGIIGIYLLSKSEIGLDSDSFVDGTHPTDLGMLKYATAYENIISKILSIPVKKVDRIMK